MSSGRKIVRKRNAQDAQSIFGNLQNEAERKKMRGTQNQFEELALDDPGEGSTRLTVAEAEARLANFKAAPEPKDVEMTGTQDARHPNAQLNMSTVTVTDPTTLNFRDIPKSLSTQCVVRQNQTPQDFGTLFGIPTKSVWHCQVVLDLGRYGKPLIMLRVRRSIDLLKSLDKNKPETYLEVKFEWQPGVFFEELEAGKEYQGQILQEPKKLYQLEQCGCNPLNNLTEESLIQEGLYNCAKDSQITSLAPVHHERLVHMNLTGRSPRIESQVKDKSKMLANTSPADKAFMESLYSDQEVILSLRFLVPADPDHKRGPHWLVAENAREFMQMEWHHFVDALQRRLPPLYQYQILDSLPRKLNLGMHMDSIQYFANRLHVIYGKEKQQQLTEQWERDGTISWWPLADNFHRYPKQMYFTSETEFLTYVQGAVIREQQWIEGEYMGFSRESVTFAIVQTYQASQLQNVPTTEEENLRQRSFFLYGYLPKDKKLQLPVPDSEWQIEFDQKLFNQPVHQVQHRRWTGFVKPMTDEERKLTGAAFVIVATKPSKGQRVSSATGIDAIKNHHHRSARMIQVINRNAPERLITACNEFCEASRQDLDRFRIPLIYSKEIKAENPVDLTEGGNLRDKTKNIATFKKLVRIFGADLNKDQKNIFNKELGKVHNGLKIILGGPGCMKTYTLALVVALLTIIDHKVLIVAEDNGSINKFMKTLEAIRVKLQAQAIEDFSPEGLAWWDKLDAQVCYRFVPPVQEMDALLDDDIAVEQGTMHKTDQVQELGVWKNNTDALQLIYAQLALRETLAKQSADNPEMSTTRADLEARLRIYQGDMQRLKSEYARMAQRCQKVNEFPAVQSLTFQLNRLLRLKREGKIPKTDQRFARIEAYEQAKDAYVANEGSPYELAKAFRAATDDMIGIVVSAASVIATTHVSCVHSLLKDKFSPTVVLHEDASRVKIPTALCAMSYSDVRAHIFVGDMQQLQPFLSSKSLNEFGEFGDVSILQFLFDKGQGFCWLAENYRNHPDILQFPNQQWYKGVLKSNPCTTVDTPDHKIFRDVMMKRYNIEKSSQYYFVNAVRGISHVQTGGTSLENWAEAKIAMEICKSLIDAGIMPEKITIDPIYRGQVNIINDYLKKVGISGSPVVSVDQYQGEDNDFTITSLTATAHQRLKAALQGEEDTYQAVSNFAKLYNRLNVGATRAKKGHVCIGSATSLDKALEKDSAGSDLRELIRDAIQRQVMLVDPTEDESPLIQNLLASTAEAQAAFEEETSHERNLAWMKDHRENRVSIKKKMPHPRPAPVTYGGPGQGGQFGAFPGRARELTKERQFRKDAVRPHETQDTGEEKAPKGYKGKPKATGKSKDETKDELKTRDRGRGQGRGKGGGGGRGEATAPRIHRDQR